MSRLICMERIYPQYDNLPTLNKNSRRLGLRTKRWKIKIKVFPLTLNCFTMKTMDLSTIYVELAYYWFKEVNNSLKRGRKEEYSYPYQLWQVQTRDQSYLWESKLT